MRDTNPPLAKSRGQMLVEALVAETREKELIEVISICEGLVCAGLDAEDCVLALQRRLEDHRRKDPE